MHFPQLAGDQSDGRIISRSPQEMKVSDTYNSRSLHGIKLSKNVHSGSMQDFCIKQGVK